ncbi:uncharacterized protein ACNS7B_015333 isoform 1-T4 [Menidia menidia]
MLLSFRPVLGIWQLYTSWTVRITVPFWVWDEPARTAERFQMMSSYACNGAQMGPELRAALSPDCHMTPVFDERSFQRPLYHSPTHDPQGSLYRSSTGMGALPRATSHCGTRPYQRNSFGLTSALRGPRRGVCRARLLPPALWPAGPGRRPHPVHREHPQGSQGICTARPGAAGGHPHAAARLSVRPGQRRSLPAAAVLRRKRGHGGAKATARAGQPKGFKITRPGITSHR